MFNQAIPTMALSVLLKEVSTDLGMNIIQAGYLWGAPQILAIFSSFFGGAITDRFGERNILIYGSFGLSILGIGRILGWDFSSLFVITMLFGFFSPLTMLANFKLFQNIFDEKELSFANGLMSAGMALGFLVGAGISATWISPLFGGWRGVFVVYGVVSLIFPILFIFVLDRKPVASRHPDAVKEIFASLANAVKNHKIWLLGFGLFGINSAVQSYLGYLPTYLLNIGWSVERSSVALMSFHLSSLFIAVLVAIYSRRLISSRIPTIVTSVCIVIGILLTMFANGTWILVTVILAGIFRDAYMAMLFTYVSEVAREIRVATGAAIGFVMMMNGVGNVIAPPIGNSFEAISKTMPFMIWAMLAAVGMLSVLFIQKNKDVQ